MRAGDTNPQLFSIWRKERLSELEGSKAEENTSWDLCLNLPMVRRFVFLSHRQHSLSSFIFCSSTVLVSLTSSSHLSVSLLQTVSCDLPGYSHF